MKKTVIISSGVILLPFFLFTTSLVQASTKSTMNVTTTGNSDSSVHIEDNSNSSNTSTYQSTSQSKITITCNGKTYTYESSGDDINANPCEGSQVKINNNTKSTTITSPNPTEIKKMVEDKRSEIKKKIDDQKGHIKATITNTPRPKQTTAIKFDLGIWLRTFFSKLF